MHEFDKKLTENRNFHLEDETSKDMQTMTLNEKLAYMESEDFQAVTLPYAAGKMSMIVFLPNEDSSVKEFEKMLTNDNWEKWKSEFNEKEGTVLLPKFQLVYETEWTLKKLGMTSAFNEEGANFTKRIKESDPLWISKIKQGGKHVLKGNKLLPNDILTQRCHSTGVISFSRRKGRQLHHPTAYLV